MHDRIHSVSIVHAVHYVFKLDAWTALLHILTGTPKLPRLTA